MAILTMRLKKKIVTRKIIVVTGQTGVNGLTPAMFSKVGSVHVCTLKSGSPRALALVPCLVKSLPGLAGNLPQKFPKFIVNAKFVMRQDVRKTISSREMKKIVKTLRVQFGQSGDLGSLWLLVSLFIKENEYVKISMNSI